MPSGGVLSLCAWGFFRAWACFACMPGPPSPAARSPPQRTRPLAPFPGWGRAGGWGEAPVVPRDAQKPRRSHRVAKPYAEGRQAAEPVRFRGVCPAGQCPHGAHSEKSAAGGALPGAYAQQCAPGDAVMGAAGVASWVRRRSSAAQAPRLRGAGRMARGDSNLRRKATTTDSNHQGCETTQPGTLEELRTKARSDPTPRRKSSPAIDRDGGCQATTAARLCAARRRPPARLTGRKRKGHAEAAIWRPTGALLRAAALLDIGTEFRHGEESVHSGLVRSTPPASLREGGRFVRLPRSDAAACGVVLAPVDAPACAGNARILPREAVSMCAGVLRGHGLQRAGIPARGGPRGARARLLGRRCGRTPSAAAEGRKAAISGGRRRRQHGAQHAPRCDADARHLPVDAVPVFRDADARPCENRPARHGSTDEDHQPLGGQPCPAQRFGLRPCAGTAQGRGHPSSRLHQRVAVAF